VMASRRRIPTGAAGYRYIQVPEDFPSVLSCGNGFGGRSLGEELFMCSRVHTDTI